MAMPTGWWTSATPSVRPGRPDAGEGGLGGVVVSGPADGLTAVVAPGVAEEGGAGERSIVPLEQLAPSTTATATTSSPHVPFRPVRTSRSTRPGPPGDCPPGAPVVGHHSYAARPERPRRE